MKAKYNIGQVVVAQNTLNYDEGAITEITKSTGAKSGLLYKVNNNFYFEDDIRSALEEIRETPNHYYDIIKSAQDDMCEEIYKLTKKFGKRTQSKDGQHIKYVLSLKSKVRPCYIKHPNLTGNTQILQVVITDAPTYNHGYIHFTDKENYNHNENSLRSEMFNIYSAVYHKVFKTKLGV